MALSIVQRKTGLDSGGAGGTVSAAFTSNITAGNTILVFQAMSDSTAVLFNQELQPPTDTLGNKYYQVGNVFDSTLGVGQEIWVAYNSPSGANTVSATDNNNEATLNIYELAGVPYFGLDKIVTTIMTSNATFTTGNISTSIANALLMAGFASGASAWVAGASYSNIQNAAGTTIEQGSEERTVSSTGTYNATATHTANTGVCSLCAMSDTASTAAACRVTKVGQTLNTTSGTHTVAGTPAVGDLIVIIRAASGSTASTAPTDNNSDGLGTYSKATSALKNTSADLMEVWVRNAKIGSATSTTFTEAPGTTTGGGLVVYRVSGMTLVGAAAVRQVATQANQAAAGTPAPVLGSTPFTTNPIFTAVFDTSNSVVANTVTPVGFVRGQSNTYATPSTTLITGYAEGGITGATLTWTAQAPTAFCSVAVELDASSTTTKTQTGVARITATTTKTQTGKARVTATTTQTQLGKSRITATTTKTQPGKANIKNTTAQTISGKGDILRTTSQTQLGVSRIQITTTKTQTGKARITATTPQTQSGKSRITATTSQTIPGKADIKKTTTQTQTGVSRIALITSQTILGKSRIALITSQTQPGKARITATTVQTQPGKARVTATTSQTQPGKARVQVTTTQTVTGKSRIQITSTKTQTGKSRITVTTLQTQTGKSRVTATSTQTVQGKSRITATTTQTILGKSRITATASKTQPGKARITATTSQTITGVANIHVASVTTTQTILGKSRVQITSSQTQTGKARITAQTSQLQLGLSRITVTTAKTQQGRARVTATAVQTIAGHTRISVLNNKTQTGLARITKVTAQAILGLSRVQVTTSQTTTGKARIGLITQQVILGASRISIGINRTIQGRANIKLITSRSIQGVAHILAPWYRKVVNPYQLAADPVWQRANPAAYAVLNAHGWYNPNRKGFSVPK